MRCLRLADFLQEQPSEKALRWIRAMRGSAYTKFYLKSRLWREVIRPKVLERDNYRCTVCKKRANQIHHLAYDEATLLGRDLSKLKSVCEEHHDASHCGNPALELGPLSARFAEVNAEQEKVDRLRADFIAAGGKLLVTAKTTRGWCACHFRWEFDPAHEAVADYSAKYFHLAAWGKLNLQCNKSNPGKISGIKLKPPIGGDHCAIFLWDDYTPTEGTIKLRISAIPHWRTALKDLTSRHPFPVTVIDATSGKTVARSGGYVEPPKPPQRPTKVLVEKWTDYTCHTTISEDSPDWDKYPFGETVIVRGETKS